MYTFGSYNFLKVKCIETSIPYLIRLFNAVLMIMESLFLCTRKKLGFHIVLNIFFFQVLASKSDYFTKRN